MQTDLLWLYMMIRQTELAQSSSRQPLQHDLPSLIHILCALVSSKREAQFGMIGHWNRDDTCHAGKETNSSTRSNRGVSIAAILSFLILRTHRETFILL